MDTVGLALGIVSAIVAVVSLVFSWRAVKTAQTSNTINLVTELHKLYHSDTMFRATQRVWELYNSYQENADGTPITPQQASQFVKETGEQSPEWKAVHNTSLFWRYLALLVNQGLVSEDIVFGAFTSPRILGFLYPIEQAFLKHTERTFNYNRSLKRLYDLWKSRQGKSDTGE